MSSETPSVKKKPSAPLFGGTEFIMRIAEIVQPSSDDPDVYDGYVVYDFVDEDELYIFYGILAQGGYNGPAGSVCFYGYNEPIVGPEIGMVVKITAENLVYGNIPWEPCRSETVPAAVQRKVQAAHDAYMLSIQGDAPAAPEA